MSLPPPLSCFDIACVSDVSQHSFFVTAYLIDLSDKTVCVCVCTFVSFFLVVMFLCTGLCGSVASLAI